MLRTIIMILSIFIFLGCSSKNLELNNRIKNSEELSKLTQTILLVERDYVENITFNNAVDKTIKGLLSKLDKNSKILNAQYNTLESKKLKENILYLKVPSLNEDTAVNIKNQITANLDINGIILDLRDNNGKSFREAIKVIDLFIDSGLIAFLESRNKKEQFMAKKENTVFKGNLYLLVNGKTLSSAELISGTLQEYKRATLIGQKTFGNEIAIDIFPISVNSTKYISLSIGNLYFPSGRSVKDAVLPDSIIEGKENQLKKAISELSRKQILSN